MINRELIRLKVVQLVYAFYQSEGKTLEIAEKELDFSLNKSYELYLYLLNMLVQVKEYGVRKAESTEAKAQRLGSSGNASSLHQFANNKLLVQIANNKTLAEYRENKKVWDEEPNFVKELYTTFIESELFENYFTKGDFSFDADKELIRKLYKTYICNNIAFDDLLEDHSLYWNDDKEIVDSFVLKTIKRFDESKGAEQELLPKYSAEEDDTFAFRLFSETLHRAKEVRQLIKSNTRNWEFSRLPFMDVIIMQIALTEILAFPLIPASVSINEYLDIAKIYSTPKSSGYINGLLDHVLKKLRKDNQLAK